MAEFHRFLHWSTMVKVELVEPFEMLPDVDGEGSCRLDREGRKNGYLRSIDGPAPSTRD